MTIGTTSSGTFYNYNKKKQTTPMVFIHGVGLTYEIWRPQLEFFRDYSNLSYDILGHGKSSLNKEKGKKIRTSPYQQCCAVLR